MSYVKEQVLRTFGDEGAETLARFFAQLEYTAFWCIRMLHGDADIVAVIPEGVEDVTIVRQHVHELHQIKTRDESQGPWTTALVLPILCKAYNHRHAFPGRSCCFHFVSNQIADKDTSLRTNTYGPLLRLKALLDIQHDGQSLSEAEEQELTTLEAQLLPRIQTLVKTSDGQQVDVDTAAELLRNTWIDTDSPYLRYPNYAYELDAQNIAALDRALQSTLHSSASYSMLALGRIYERLLLTIFGKILTKLIPR